MFENRLALHTWTLDTTPLAGVLAAGKQAVLHRLEDDGRAIRFRWEDRRESGFDLREPFVEIRGEL